jgi:hypothetical protein
MRERLEDFSYYAILANFTYLYQNHKSTLPKSFPETTFETTILKILPSILRVSY